MGIIDILTRYHSQFASGLAITVCLCLIVWIGGLVSGITLGVLSARFTWSVAVPFRSLAFLLSGLPVLVMLFWAHYPLQSLLGVVIDPFLTASTVLTIVNTIAVADSVRSVINDFPTQYLSAAKVCGLSSRVTFFRIQLPIVARQLVPMLVPIQIAMMHNTILASLISVEEVFRVAQRINASVYRPVEIYTAIGLFFLLISLPANALAIWLRQRFTRNLSES